MQTCLLDLSQIVIRCQYAFKGRDTMKPIKSVKNMLSSAEINLESVNARLFEELTVCIGYCSHYDELRIISRCGVSWVSAEDEGNWRDGEYVTGYAEMRNEEDLINHIKGLESIPNIHTDLNIGDYRKSDLFLAAINRVIIPTGRDFKSANIDEFGREYNIGDGYKLFYIDTSEYPILKFYDHLVDFDEVNISIDYRGQQINELLEEFVEKLRIVCGDISECNILFEKERVIPLLETKEEMVEYAKRYIVYKAENLDFGF